MATQFKLRRDTAANWTSANPTLASGEPGLETDTGKLKFGNGATPWTSLTYFPGALDAAAIASGTLASARIPDLDAAKITTGTLGAGRIPTALPASVVLTSPEETVTLSATASTGTINFDCATQTELFYTTNSAGNFTLNFRGSASVAMNTLLAVGQSITAVFLCTNGAAAYYANGFQIDGASVTPKWQNGSAPSMGNANAIDAYSFTIIKTGSAAYTVLASQVKFA